MKNDIAEFDNTSEINYLILNKLPNLKLNELKEDYNNQLNVIKQNAHPIINSEKCCFVIVLF